VLECFSLVVFNYDIKLHSFFYKNVKVILNKKPSHLEGFLKKQRLGKL